MIEIITEADYKDRLAATQNGVLLFFKKLCPHCKNMEKVLEKFGAAKPGIALYGIDIEENAAAAAALGAERPPTRISTAHAGWRPSLRGSCAKGRLRPAFRSAATRRGRRRRCPAAPACLRRRPPPGRTARRDSSTEFYFSCLEWISAYSQTECTVERPRTPFAKLTIIS